MEINIPKRTTGVIRCRDLSQHIPARTYPAISSHSLQPRQRVYGVAPAPSAAPAQPYSSAPSPAPQQSSVPSPAPQRSSVPPPAPVQTQAPPVMPKNIPTPPLPPDAATLQKGQKINITSANGAAPSKIVLGVGWQIKDARCELDMSAFMLDGNSRIIGDDWFVFYGQPVSPDGSIRFSDTAGADIESITVDLQKVSPSVERIALVVTINEALQKRLNFSMVQDVYVRILDSAAGKETVRFLLTDYYSSVTAMVVGELYRYKGMWKLNAVGDGVAKDLAGLCAMYGVEVES